jgi:hypothetical protein
VRRAEDLVTSKEKGLAVYSEGNTHILEIDSTKIDDAGVYTVVAFNKVGKITTKTDFIVQSI